ncbi:MAG: SHOCT domain-containing protein [Mycobacterium sp.]
MMWYGGDWGWGGWLLMTVAMIVFWALLITAVVLLVRYLVSASRGSGVPPTAAGPGSAEETLAQRYARGEIDDDEYRQRLTLLRQHR